MFCTKCGTMVGNDAKFCHVCGNSLEELSVQYAAAQGFTNAVQPEPVNAVQQAPVNLIQPQPVNIVQQAPVNSIQPQQVQGMAAGTKTKANKTVFQIVSLALAIFLNVCALASPFVVKLVAHEVGFTPHVEMIAVIFMASVGVTMVIFSFLPLIRNVRVSSIIGIVFAGINILFTGFLYIIEPFALDHTVFDIMYDGVSSDVGSILKFLMNGYLYIFILLFVNLAVEKKGRTQARSIFQTCLIVLLFVSAAANILVAATQGYGFFGIFWETIFFTPISVAGSIACAFWGVWSIKKN